MKAGKTKQRLYFKEANTMKYLTPSARAMLEATLFYLQNGADRSGIPPEKLVELSRLSDPELEAEINRCVARM